MPTTERWRDEVVTWLAAHLARRLAEAPERVLVAGVLALIGLVAVLGLCGVIPARPGSVRDLLPAWVAYEWALSLFVGGLASLVGYWRRARALERLGQVLVILGCLTYALAVLLFVGWPGVFSALVFLGIAAAYGIRRLVAAAAQVHAHRAEANGQLE